MHKKKSNKEIKETSINSKNSVRAEPVEAFAPSKSMSWSEDSSTNSGKTANYRSALNQGVAQTQGAWNQLQGEALNEALAAYNKGIQEAISSKSGGFTLQSMDQQQGFAAEAHHVGSFNIEAAAKGENNHRATLGIPNDRVTDIHVITPNGTTKHQVKFYKDGKKTALALSKVKYDDIGKIVPKDQVDSVKASANKQALRKDTPPEVSKSNQDTANNATDKLMSKDGKVSSKGLNRKGDGSAEELVNEAKTKEGGSKYKETERVRSGFNSMQYRNAAKSGAIGGAVSESAPILLEVLRSDDPLTKEQCLDMAQRVVVSAVKGAGNALLTTSIQHVGQAMIDAAVKQTTKTIGKQLVKGNVATAVAQITIQMAQDMYKFSTGEIDNLQFASATIGGVMQVVGSGLAFTAGTGVATYLGASVPAAISAYTIGGTTMGTLGVMATGTVFAIGFAVAAGAYVNHFSSKGEALANADLKTALELLNGGQIDLSTYAGKVGTMAELTFSWCDILPFSGAISVISEYEHRKKHLRATQADILDQMGALPVRERAMMQYLANQYNKAITDIDRQYHEARTSITKQALDQFDSMSNDLNNYLQMQYLMFAPIRKHYIEHSELMDVELRKQQEDKKRSESFALELEELQSKLNGITVSDHADRAIKQAMQRTILTRMEMLIPHKTGWDQACEFLELQ